MIGSRCKCCGRKLARKTSYFQNSDCCIDCEVPQPERADVYECFNLVRPSLEVFNE